jgi:hypothetical protein
MKKRKKAKKELHANLSLPAEMPKTINQQLIICSTKSPLPCHAISGNTIKCVLSNNCVPTSIFSTHSVAKSSESSIENKFETNVHYVRSR